LIKYQILKKKNYQTRDSPAFQNPIIVKSCHVDASLKSFNNSTRALVKEREAVP